MPDISPRFEPGREVTCRTSADVIGGRIVAITGAPVDGLTRVAHAANGNAAPYGVAARDKASGTDVMVFRPTAGIVPITVGAGAITAGQPVMAGAAGVAVPATAGKFAIGQAVNDAAATGVVDVALGIFTVPAA